MDDRVRSVHVQLCICKLMTCMRSVVIALNGSFTQVYDDLSKEYMGTFPFHLNLCANHEDAEQSISNKYNLSSIPYEW